MSAQDFGARGKEHLQLCLERDRLLCSPEFARSPVMSKLLAFLVNHKLQDNSQPLKAYTIAVEALGRSEDFDPHTDSYPRVIIGRLRKIIDNYYLRNPGATRLFIPLNQYEIMLEGAVNETVSERGPESIKSPGISAYPQFNEHKMPIAQADNIANTEIAPAYKGIAKKLGKAMRQPLIDYIVAGIVVAVTMSAVLFAYFANGESPAPVDTQIGYPSIRVVDMTKDQSVQPVGEQASAFFNQSFLPFGGIETVISEPSDTISSDYRFVVEAVNIAGGRLNLRLIRERNNALLWSKIVAVPNEMPTIRYDLERTIAQLLGNSGIIIQDQSYMNRNSFKLGYHCILQADSYLRFRDKALLKPVMACMKETVKTFPDDPYILEKMSFVTWIAQRQDDAITFSGTGSQLAKRALRAAPNNAYAAFAESRSAFFEGNCERGEEWAKKATQANPLDPHIIGYHAIYLAGCNDPRAEKLAERAIDLDPDVDLGVYAVLALLRYQQGDFEAAHRLSKRKLADSSRIDPGLLITCTLSALAIGKKQEAMRTWKNLNNHLGLAKNSSPAATLKNYIVNPKLRAAVLNEFSRYDFPYA
jgi:tetratricopeptide (TPR) repeat protein